MPDRNQFLQVIRQKLTSDVETTDCPLDWSSFEEWGDRCVGKPGVDQEQAFGGKNSGTIWRRRGTRRSTEQMSNIMIGVQRWTYLANQPLLQRFVIDIPVDRPRHRL